MKDLIQIIQVLEENEIKIVNDYIDTLSFSKVGTFDSKPGKLINNSFRSNLGSVLDENHEATKILHNKFNKCLLDYRERLIKVNCMFQGYPVPGGYNTSSEREGIQVLEYFPGQEYIFHHDIANNVNQKEHHRIISIVLYLNKEFEGGGTEFPHQIYKPSPGYGLFFPSNWCFPHSGQKVISGKKRVIVTWYYVNEISENSKLL